MKIEKSLLSVIMLFSLFSCTKNEDPAVTTPPPVTSTLKDGLLVHLPFNGNFNDASGNKNNATGVNGIDFSMNRFFEDTKAVNMNGTSNWIEIPEQKIVGLQKFSFYIEFMPTSIQPQCLMGKRTYNPATTTPLSQSFNFLINYSGAPVRFSLRKAGQCNSENISAYHNPLTSGSEQLMLNCWNNVVGTYDGAIQKLYVNGRLVGEQAISAVEMCAGDPIRVGTWWKDDPLYFSGKIDEVRIYNRAITSQEVKDLYKLSN